MGFTVTADDLSGNGDGDDAIVVRVNGREVGSYCIVEDARRERWLQEKTVLAIHDDGRSMERAEIVAYLRAHALRADPRTGRTMDLDLAALAIERGEASRRGK